MCVCVCVCVSVLKGGPRKRASWSGKEQEEGEERQGGAVETQVGTTATRSVCAIVCARCCTQRLPPHIVLLPAGVILYNLQQHAPVSTRRLLRDAPEDAEDEGRRWKQWASRTMGVTMACL
jgi:hypothetical protein